MIRNLYQQARNVDWWLWGGSTAVTLLGLVCFQASAFPSDYLRWLWLTNPDIAVLAMSFIYLASFSTWAFIYPFLTEKLRVLVFVLLAAWAGLQAGQYKAAMCARGPDLFDSFEITPKCFHGASV